MVRLETRDVRFPSESSCSGSWLRVNFPGDSLAAVSGFVPWRDLFHANGEDLLAVNLIFDAQGRAEVGALHNGPAREHISG